MRNTDSVLSAYLSDRRSMYIVATVTLFVYSAVVLYYQETWASACMFALVTALLWSFYWNTGRRIANGSFGACMSFWSRLERADLSRWLEYHGGTRMKDGNLQG